MVGLDVARWLALVGMIATHTLKAPFVGADMDVMISDAHRMRGELPVIAQSLVETPDAPEVAKWVLAQL